VTPTPPRSSRTSIWPAASVLITAIVMLAIFMVLNIATDTKTVSTTTTTPIVVGGVSVQTGVNDGANALRGCHLDGTPPANITTAFLLPSPTTPANAARLANAGAGDFDCLRSFVSHVTPSTLLGFFQSQLEVRGWNLFSTGATNGAPQDLFQKAGSDTFYWVVGVTVNKVVNGDTFWTYRVFQNSNSI